MMRSMRILALGLAALAFVGCEKTDKEDSGGVLLSIIDFNGLPVVVSASGSGGIVQVDEITVQSVVRNPNGATSDLMNVEIQSYEVTFRRADTGTRIPPPLVEHVFGIVEPNGQFTLNNGPIMRFDQFNTVPIKDLLQFGVDRETNSEVIRLTVAIRFFGRTLSGDAVDSEPALFTLEVVP
jgi:hypothetical protein